MAGSQTVSEKQGDPHMMRIPIVLYLAGTDPAFPVPPPESTSREWDHK